MWPKRRCESPIWSRCFVIPPRKNGQPAPRRSPVSTSAASVTTPSSSNGGSRPLPPRGRPRRSAPSCAARPRPRRAPRRPRSRRARARAGSDRDSVVHPFEHVIRDARADHLQQDRRRHRHAERHDRLVDLLDGSAVLDCVHDHARHAGQHAVDDEARSVVDEDRSLAQLLAEAHTVASATSSVSAARTTSSSGISATGLKKCMPATARDGQVGRHLGDRKGPRCSSRGCIRRARPPPAPRTPAS